MSDFGKKGKSPFVDEDFVARAGIEPATHGFSVHSKPKTKKPDPPRQNEEDPSDSLS